MSDDRPGPDWDAKYAAARGGLFGEAANAWLAMCLARPGVEAGSALCLADGDGRNGTWLAAQGVAVSAVDLSAEATRRAEARDRAAGVTAERRAADLFDWSPGGRAWDLVALICLQGPPALRRRGLELAAEALAPGGWLVLEGFGTGAAARGRPECAGASRRASAGWPAAGWSCTRRLRGRCVSTRGPCTRARPG